VIDSKSQVNFVIGGTQKGGTSALDSFLRQHPQICMPKTKKELHFFDREDFFSGKPDYRRYHDHFRPKAGHRVMGEATPMYMYWDTAPARIWSYNPEMKWILVLRNPVERAFSAWNMETKRGTESLPFRDAIEQEAVRCRAALPWQHRIFSYADRGFYAYQVRRLFNIFGRDHCLVLLNEDLRGNHEETLRKTFDFLGVDPSFVPKPADVFHHDYEQTVEPTLSSTLTEMFLFDIKELEQLLHRSLASWYSQ
jgi:hypothetical protein